MPSWVRQLISVPGGGSWPTSSFATCPTLHPVLRLQRRGQGLGGLCRQAAANTRAAFDAIENDPCPAPRTDPAYQVMKPSPMLASGPTQPVGQPAHGRAEVGRSGGPAGADLVRGHERGVAGGQPADEVHERLDLAEGHVGDLFGGPEVRPLVLV